MRVSTAQFYFQSSQQITNKSSDVNDQIGYISSGKRILTAKDDAVAYGTLAGYKESLQNIEKYERNITQAESRNSLQEVSFSNAEDILQELKQLFVQANNGSLSSEDLYSLSELVGNSQQELLNIANSKDETGGYIFSGFQIDKEPFTLATDNSVDYQGDSGIRELQIAKNVMVELNQPGDAAFQNVNNAIGDFIPSYITNTSGINVASAVIADPSNYDSLSFPPEYTFSFTAPSDLTVTDSNGATVYPTTTYTAGQTIAFNGVEVQISGNPLPGDQLTLGQEENISVFDTIKSAIDWMNVGTTSATPEQHQVDHEEILNQLSNALSHMTIRQTDAGVRGNLIDHQKTSHLDTELVMSKGQSNLEDLDYAKAISKFEQSQVALQAAQQVFVKIKDLSLFNYI
ncbi:MAG: flagellar hook-associated protein FlgL [Colwellia sp.]|nr:flagellar hook-associated protein FlgL [Colwellia sp.]